MFFHFIQAIAKHMKSYGKIKSKITKYSFEIIKNIELICFIPPSFINYYNKFLENKLNKEN